jgi:hypothetical protein
MVVQGLWAIACFCTGNDCMAGAGEYRAAQNNFVKSIRSGSNEPLSGERMVVSAGCPYAYALVRCLYNVPHDACLVTIKVRLFLGVLLHCFKCENSQKNFKNRGTRKNGFPSSGDERANNNARNSTEEVIDHVSREVESVPRDAGFAR